MTEFVTVAIFNFQYEIAVLKTILEKEKIHYLFLNEHLVSIDPLASIAYGGIKLKVHPNDVSQVKEIIDKLNNNLYIVK